MTRLTPMLSAGHAATVDWYRWLGFELVGTDSEKGKWNWARVQFGAVDIMFVPHRETVAATDGGGQPMDSHGPY